MIAVTDYIILMLLISVVAGILGAMVGIGGGILVVPALTILFGVPIEYAIGASIISTIATSSGSASAYVKDRIANVRIGMFLEMGSVFGAIVGVLTTLYFVKSGLTSVIFLVFGFALFLSAYNIIQSSRIERRGESLVNTASNPLSERFDLKGEYQDQSSHEKIAYVATRVPAGLVVIFFAGLLSGLLGVGGGVLKVLGMDTMMRLPFKVSTTTSNFMIGVTATASTGILFVSGYVNVVLAAPVALGVVIGSLMGAKVLNRSKPASIRLLFIVLLVALGLEMVYMGVLG